MFIPYSPTATAVGDSQANTNAERIARLGLRFCISTAL
jgi:hypothetical protein